MKNSKGITLIALVITIIVLLILAGISISLVTGQSGILNKGKSAVDATEVGAFLEQASMSYAEVYSEKAANRLGTATVSTAEIVGKLTSRGYTIHQVVPTGEITSINVSSPSMVEGTETPTIKLVKGTNKESATITVMPASYAEEEPRFYAEEEPRFYAEVRSKYYQIIVNELTGQITLGTELSELPSGAGEEKALSATFSGTGSEMLEIPENGINQTAKTVTVNFNSTADVTGADTAILTITYGSCSKQVTVDINGSASVTATSADTTKGTVALTGTTPYELGTTVTITPTAATGYVFDKWTVDSTDYVPGSSGTGISVDENGVLTYTVAGAKAFIATFISPVESYVGYYINKGTESNPEYAIIYADLLADSGKTLRGVLGSVTMPTAVGTFKTYSKSDSTITPTGSKFGANYLVTLDNENDSGNPRFLAMRLTDESGRYFFAGACDKGVEGRDTWFLPSRNQWVMFGAGISGITKDNYNQFYGLQRSYWSSTSVSPQRDGTATYASFSYPGMLNSGKTNNYLYVRLSTSY